jgi:hypothetical protein
VNASVRGCQRCTTAGWSLLPAASNTHENVSRSVRPRLEIVVTRALSLALVALAGLSGGPSGGTLGGQRGGARRGRQKTTAQESQRTQTAQETLRKRHPVTARGDAHHLRRCVRLMLWVAMQRRSQQVPYTHVCVFVFVCLCLCVCVFMCVCPFHIPHPDSLLRFREKMRFGIFQECVCVFVWFLITPPGI